MQIVPATHAHAHAIRLREGDAREVAAFGLDSATAIGRSLDNSLWAETYLFDGEIGAVTGLALPTLTGDIGTPWLLTGPACERHRKTVMVESRRQIARMLDTVPRLEGRVHAEYDRAVALLRWLGFALDAPEGGFRRYHRTRESLCIGPSTIANLEADPDFAGVVAQYAAEGTVEGAPPPQAKMAQYRQLEASGALHVVSATVDGTLAGFVVVLAASLPHCAPMAVTDSFFVLKAHRHTLAGLKLLVAAEAKAAALGSPGLLMSAPAGSDMARILPRAGYAEVGRSFFKKVSP